MSNHDPDAALRLTLKRHRAFATGLLVAMAALILFSYRLPPILATRPSPALVAAGAE